MAPVLAVMVVGGYGFVVWVYQMIAGPPAPFLHEPPPGIRIASADTSKELQ